jgi:hypothetical protein
MYGQTILLQNPENADMRHATREAAAQRQTDTPGSRHCHEERLGIDLRLPATHGGDPLTPLEFHDPLQPT